MVPRGCFWQVDGSVCVKTTHLNPIGNDGIMIVSKWLRAMFTLTTVEHDRTALFNESCCHQLENNGESLRIACIYLDLLEYL